APTTMISAFGFGAVVCPASSRLASAASEPTPAPAVLRKRRRSGGVTAKFYCYPVSYVAEGNDSPTDLLSGGRMDKPRIFLGSSGKQEKLLQALTRGLEDVAHVEPWTTSFNPGTTTLERLLELAHEVDFAAFAFARDDWTTNTPPASDPTGSGQASPRDNVVFEAGLFGGALGMRRTF